MDIGLPGMDGYEVARRLKQQPGMESVCLAAVTGYGQANDRNRTQEAGFQYHLVKPVDLHLLQELLARKRNARDSLRNPPRAHRLQKNGRTTQGENARDSLCNSSLALHLEKNGAPRTHVSDEPIRKRTDVGFLFHSSRVGLGRPTYRDTAPCQFACDGA